MSPMTFGPMPRIYGWTFASQGYFTKNGASSPAADIDFGPSLPSNGQSILLYHGSGVNDFVRYGLGMVSDVMRLFCSDGGQIQLGRIDTINGTTFRELMRLESNGNLGLGGPSDTRLTVQEAKTLNQALTEGYAGTVTGIPIYEQAFTVTRHNYMHLRNPTLSFGAVLTDACIARFDAAAGTHKAVDSGTTKSSPGTVSAWLKFNINGTIYYVPSYTSKTS